MLKWGNGNITYDKVRKRTDCKYVEIFIKYNILFYVMFKLKSNCGNLLPIKREKFNFFAKSLEKPKERCEINSESDIR